MWLYTLYVSFLGCAYNAVVKRYVLCTSEALDSTQRDVGVGERRKEEGRGEGEEKEETNSYLLEDSHCLLRSQSMVVGFTPSSVSG